MRSKNVLDVEFITGVSGAIASLQEKDYRPILQENGLKRTSDGGYYKLKRTARLNLLLSGADKLSVTLALWAARQKLNANVYYLTAPAELADKPTIAINCNGKGEQIRYGVGTPVSGYTRITLIGDEALLLYDKARSLGDDTVSVTAKIEGDNLVIEAYHYVTDALERFTMRLAHLTMDKRVRVIVDAAYAPVTQSNELLSYIYPLLPSDGEIERRSELTPYHGVKQIAVIELGNSEQTIMKITDFLRKITEDR